jgi:hypothetical protein
LMSLGLHMRPLPGICGMQQHLWKQLHRQSMAPGLIVLSVREGGGKQVLCMFTSMCKATQSCDLQQLRHASTSVC